MRGAPDSTTGVMSRALAPSSAGSESARNSSSCRPRSEPAMVVATASSDCCSLSRNTDSISRAYWHPAHGSVSVVSASNSSLVRSRKGEIGPKFSRSVIRPTALFHPAVAHAVHGVHGIELLVDDLEFAADALDVRGDRVVVEHHVRRIHELLAVLHVAGMLRKRVDDPELRERQQDHLAVPGDRHAFAVERERAAPDDLLFLGWTAQRIDAAEQGVHARDEMRE